MLFGDATGDFVLPDEAVALGPYANPEWSCCLWWDRSVGQNPYCPILRGRGRCALQSSAQVGCRGRHQAQCGARAAIHHSAIFAPAEMWIEKRCIHILGKVSTNLQQPFNIRPRFDCVALSTHRVSGAWPCTRRVLLLCNFRSSLTPSQYVYTRSFSVAMPPLRLPAFNFAS